jgi:hypothetical protein
MLDSSFIKPSYKLEPSLSVKIQKSINRIVKLVMDSKLYYMQKYNFAFEVSERGILRNNKSRK